MDVKSVYIMTSNMLGQRTRMDMIADNVANANTIGYKKQEIDFAEVVSRKSSQKVGSFSHHRGTRTDFTNGGFTNTKNPLDIAINGDGMFAVQRGNQVVFTRGGQFTMDTEGNLINHKGESVLDSNFGPINIPVESTSIMITKDGTIANQEGVIAALGVFTFDNQQSLKRAGNSAWVANNPNDAVLSEQAHILQGFVEDANVNGIEESVNMTEMLRSYQSTAKLVNQMETLEQRVIRDLARMP